MNYAFERQKLIAVVFVLLLPRRDFGGKPFSDIRGQGVKLIKDFHNASLLLKGWERDLHLLNN